MVSYSFAPRPSSRFWRLTNGADGRPEGLLPSFALATILGMREGLLTDSDDAEGLLDLVPGLGLGLDAVHAVCGRAGDEDKLLKALDVVDGSSLMHCDLGPIKKVNMAALENT